MRILCHNGRAMSMDRDELIRVHFDAYSDLVWVKDLEPKFKAARLDTAEMEEYREAWRGHTEARDWDWWLDKVKGMSNVELQREIAECRAEIDAFRKQTETIWERLERMSKDTKQSTQQEAKNWGRE